MSRIIKGCALAAVLWFKDKRGAKVLESSSTDLTGTDSHQEHSRWGARGGFQA